MIINVRSLTIGRGLLRIYLVIWMCGLLVLSFFIHKELLTSLGVTYWTEEAVLARERLKYEALGCNEETNKRSYACSQLLNPNIAIPLEGWIDHDEAEHTVKLFLLAGVLLPLILLLAATILWYLLKWAIDGFFSNHTK